MCAGTVIVHSDRTMTCTDPDCPIPAGAAFMAHHVVYVACNSLGHDEPCPRCASVACTES